MWYNYDHNHRHHHNHDQHRCYVTAAGKCKCVCMSVNGGSEQQFHKGALTGEKAAGSLTLAGYAEGTKFHKAITVFNDGCGDVNLGKYRIRYQFQFKRAHTGELFTIEPMEAEIEPVRPSS